MKPCGTRAAYFRHLYHGEEPCPEDREALLTAAEARRRARGAKPRKQLRHGTRTLYQRGCRCEACRWAETEYMAAWRAGVTRRDKARGSLTELIVDILGTWRRGMTPSEVAWEVERIRGSAKEETIRRLLERARSKGRVSVVDGFWKIREE